MILDQKGYIIVFKLKWQGKGIFEQKKYFKGKHWENIDKKCLTKKLRLSIVYDKQNVS